MFETTNQKKICLDYICLDYHRKNGPWFETTNQTIIEINHSLVLVVLVVLHQSVPADSTDLGPLLGPCSDASKHILVCLYTCRCTHARKSHVHMITYKHIQKLYRICFQKNDFILDLPTQTRFADCDNQQKPTVNPRYNANEKSGKRCSYRDVG